MMETVIIGKQLKPIFIRSNKMNNEPLPEGHGEEPGFDDGHIGW